MDPAHIHLVITHLPIFASILAALVLIFGIWQKSDSTKKAAYLLLMIAAAGAGIAYLTGEAAEEVAEKIPGVAENMIEQHEEAAFLALMALIASGVAALAGLYFTVRKSSWARPSAMMVLILCLVGFGLSARAGYYGGKIRHTEIGSRQVSTTEKERGDDD